MTTALPTNISYGKVRGRFGSPILAAGDADGLPDFVPLSGLEIIFTPKPDVILNLGASPVPVTFLTEKIVCTLDADGYLVGPDGREGVNLIATDDEDLAPTGWTYNVGFGGTQATYKRLATFDISVPAASSRWLTAIAPIQSSAGGSALTEVQAAVVQMGVAVGQAQSAASAATSAAQAATAATANKVDKGSLVINVKDHGVVGNGTADDTTALRAAVAAIPTTGGTLLIPPGLSVTVSGSITATGIAGLKVIGTGSWITQKTAVTKTLNLVNCSKVVIEGVTLVGKGTENIKQGIGVTSYNGVAGIFLRNCSRVSIRDSYLVNHAGGGIRWDGNLVSAVITANKIVGIGGTPGNSDNCSDFAVGMCGVSSDRNIWITDNDISGTNFGIGATTTDGLFVEGNNIHDIPGQHGVYAAECSNTHINSNTILNVALDGIKNQIGVPPNNIDVISAECSHNIIDGCSNGIVWASVLTDLSKTFTATKITDNTIRNAAQDGINTKANVQARISGNQVDTAGRYGIYAGDFNGDIYDNRLYRTQAHAIYATIVEDTHIARNRIKNCALSASANAAWSSHIYVGRSTNALVSQPTLRLTDNTHRMTSEPSTFTRVTIADTGVQVFHDGTENYTSKGFTFGTAGEVIYNAVGYSPLADFSVSALNNPSTPVNGRGKRELFGSQSPQAAGMTSFFRQGDICWHSAPTTSTPPGWVCTTSGSPGTWTAFANPASSSSTFAGWVPANNTYIGASADPQLISAGQGSVTPGVLYVAKLQAPNGGTIGHVRFAVSTIGSGLTTGQCLVGVWSASGVQIGTSTDVSTILTTSGIKNVTITAMSGQSLTVAAGDYVFVGLLQNGSAPAIVRGPVSSAFANDQLSGFNVRYGTMGTGQTALPNPLVSLAAAATWQGWFAITS